MVEFIEDSDKQTCICKSDKMLTALIISKEVGGHNGFVVSLEKGPTPNELSGKYSSIAAAKVGVAKYLRNKKDTVGVRRARVAERISKNGSKDRTESS